MKWKTILTFIVLYEMLLFGVPFLDMYLSTITAYLVGGLVTIGVIYFLEKMSFFNKRAPLIVGIIILVAVVVVGLFV
ncbi:hypothetical protein ACTWPF_13875 [Oceanobacillus sp. M65]|jgi:hypothetical protein|uniref:Uncharacterized protein n=1 Tax=Oceanobacillus jordanicus TaxID=2867266 RepID=A0AAW5B5V7_9BACI|nr:MULTISPECIES: hypothetical protein [Oceanobacillus]MCG3418564.1 hypothetical protein [Oceanobacillus jordanicus]RIU89411.1 hypothetical protein D1864_15500 [Oceanobacillus picturae]